MQSLARLKRSQTPQPRPRLRHLLRNPLTIHNKPNTRNRPKSTARAAEMPMREKRYEASQQAVPKIRAQLSPEQQQRNDRITGNAHAEWERRTKTGDE